MIERRGRRPGRRPPPDRAGLSWHEGLIHVGIAVLLLAAGVLLAAGADQLIDIIGDVGSDPIVEVADALVLVVLVVELVSAMRRRQLGDGRV